MHMLLTLIILSQLVKNNSTAKLEVSEFITHHDMRNKLLIYFFGLSDVTPNCYIEKKEKYNRIISLKNDYLKIYDANLFDSYLEHLEYYFYFVELIPGENILVNLRNTSREFYQVKKVKISKKYLMDELPALTNDKNKRKLIKYDSRYICYFRNRTNDLILYAVNESGTIYKCIENEFFGILSKNNSVDINYNIDLNKFSKIAFEICEKYISLTLKIEENLKDCIELFKYQNVSSFEHQNLVVNIISKNVNVIPENLLIKLLSLKINNKTKLDLILKIFKSPPYSDNLVFHLIKYLETENEFSLEAHDLIITTFFDLDKNYFKYMELKNNKKIFFSFKNYLSSLFTRNESLIGLRNLFRKYPYIFQYIENIDEGQIIKAVQIYPLVIKYVNNKTEKIAAMTLEQSVFYLNYIEHWNINLCNILLNKLLKYNNSRIIMSDPVDYCLQLVNNNNTKIIYCDNSDVL